MFDDKKGQVTVFIIVGIILLIAVGMVFYIYGDRLRVGPEVKFDAGQVEPLKNYVEQCIEREGGEVIKLVSEHGGRIEPEFGYYYGEEKVAYLCYTEEFMPCENKMPFIRKEIEKEMNAHLAGRIKECVDLDSFKDYEIQEGEMKVSTSVGDENVLVVVDYPLTLSKGNSVMSQDKFSHNFKVSLGRLADVASDVVDSEIISGTFFSESYELSHPGVVVHHGVSVKEWKPVSTKTRVYTVYTRENPDLKFRFAVKGWVVPND